MVFLLYKDWKKKGICGFCRKLLNRIFDQWHIHSNTRSLVMIKKLMNLFKLKEEVPKLSKSKKTEKKKVEPTRIGEIGEYKINIQLDHFTKDCKYISDIMINNSKSKTGYSQIDHIVVSPYCIFVIETKNYNGVIKGSRNDQNWTVNGRFKMYNPIKQNYGHVMALQSLLLEYSALQYISMISFTMRCRFGIDPELRKIESNELIIYDVELSEYISRKINRLKLTSTKQPLNSNEIEIIFKKIHEANITDPIIRMKHVKSVR
jgi:hypothetical protein